MPKDSRAPVVRRISEVGKGKKVIVLGGGIGGLSSAHELSARGFTVEVYERWERFGGKARSMRMRGTGMDGRSDLPGEHGFRFFPYFYRHIPDTMERIPYGTNSGGVFDNLQWGAEVGFARENKALTRLPIRFPRDRRDVLSILGFVAQVTGLARLGFIRRRLHLTKPTIDFAIGMRNAAYFCWRMLVYMTSCDARRLAQYEGTRWWDFIDADNPKRPDAYRQFLAEGLTRSLVACKAREASTRSVASIMAQMIRDLLHPGKTLDRLLDGPTNDVWIDPWREYLEARKVTFHASATVREIDFDFERRRVNGVSIVSAAGEERVEGDFYVSALPVEVMWRLIQSRAGELSRNAPSLARLGELKVEWMNGIQFYLEEDLKVVDGHAIYIDSPWALTSVSQHRFWDGAHRPSLYGSGRVRSILSVDISDWRTPGRFTAKGKPAMACRRSEIAAEVWDQLMVALPDHAPRRSGGKPSYEWFLDPDIITIGRRDEEAAHDSLYGLRDLKAVEEFLATAGSEPDQPFKAALGNRPAKVENAEPLLVNTINSWRCRPEAKTEIANLFLASDYVRTHTDLATMEGAGEAARRAVNGILEECKVRPRSRMMDFIEDHPILTFPVRIFTDRWWTHHPYCRVWKLQEWWWFAPFRVLDRVTFGLRGKKHDPVVPAALATALMLILAPLALLFVVLGMIVVWVRSRPLSTS